MKFAKLRLLLAALCFTQSGFAVSANNIPDRQGVYLAPGWGKLSFEAPAAGSYKLPIIDLASDGQVASTEGEDLNLSELMGDKITLLSFIYRTCDDVNGCPLSTMVLYTVGSKIDKEPALKDKLRLLTLSFDPASDTPEVMQEFGESILGKSQVDWHFLTTKSEQQIQPILDAYQQSVVPDVIAEGKPRKFSHLLRVFLIDRNKQVRNIYSLSFLHPDILINDIKTLLLEEENAASLATLPSK
jgi:cytochrome c peroxidase